jgi:hypothetical protein
MHLNISKISLVLAVITLSFACTKDKKPTVGITNKIVITTNPFVTIGSDSAICSGEITSDGGDNITERGICYSINENPTLNNSKVASGSGKGIFTCNLINLQPNTTYYIKAYCLSNQGEIFGKQENFKTLPRRPTISTNQISNIQIESAVGGGVIISDGGAPITEKGLCISSLNSTPVRTDTFISAGQGSTSFSSSISNLKANRNYFVRAYAKNSQGETYGGNTVQFKTLPAQPPNVSNVSVNTVSSQSARLYASILSNQGAIVTQYGFCVSQFSNPTILNSTVINFFGSPTATFIGDVINLNPNTTYFIRAFAYNSAGGPSYSSSPSSFTTLSLLRPDVTTVSVGTISLNSASVTGNLSDDGGSIVTERGFLYSFNSILTTNNSKVIVPGNSIGLFSGSLSGLSSNSTYYVAAYARNSIGTSISTNVLSFRTLTPNPPSIQTTPISNLTNSSFQSGGTFSSDGGAPIVQKGICWNNFGNPTINDTKTFNGSGNSGFSVSSSTITQLTPNIIYFIRAYATNDGGITGYGNQISVLTKLNSVQLLSPLNNANIGCCNQILSWITEAGATSYEIEIAMNSLFSATDYSLQICGSGSLIANRVNRIYSNKPSICIGMGPSENNGTWFWRVRPLSSNNSGDWSEIRSFYYKW